MTEIDYDPAMHYDRVTEAWRLLLGEELHYGVFEDDDETLTVATGRLTALMIEAALGATPGGASAAGRRTRLLDVGCGTGAPACQLAADHDLEVVGITTSEAGVATATARARDLALATATFEVRDGMDNGFRDAHFDLVWALESSHLMRDRQAFVAESARVLRPGGRFVMCDLVRHREIQFLEVRSRRADFAVLREAFGDAHFQTLQEYADLATAEGLEPELVRDLTVETLPTFDRWRRNAAEHEAAVVDLIGEQGHAAFVRSCDLLEEFWRDGTFGYGLLAFTKPTTA